MTHEPIKLLRTVAAPGLCRRQGFAACQPPHVLLPNKDVCLPSPHSQSSCPHHEQSQMLRDMGGNFCWTRWKTKVKLLPNMPKCFFSWQPVAAHPRGIGKKEPLTPVRRSARLQKSIILHQQPEIQERLLQLPSPTSITLDKEVCPPVLIQIRPLTPAEASAQSISLGQTFPFRSKAKAKWRAWTESKRWGQSIESSAFAEPGEAHTKTTSSLSCKSHCWGRCTHRSRPLQQEQRRRPDPTLDRRRKLVRRKFRGRQQHE